MSDADLTKLDRDALVALILQQAVTIDTLQTRIDELTRSGKRHEGKIGVNSHHGSPLEPLDRKNPRRSDPISALSMFLSQAVRGRRDWVRSATGEEWPVVRSPLGSFRRVGLDRRCAGTLGLFRHRSRADR